MQVKIKGKKDCLGKFDLFDRLLETTDKDKANIFASQLASTHHYRKQY